MKKKCKKITIFLGVVCVLLVAVSSWYTIVFNEARLILPMELSEYVFRVQDLPMIISCILLALYLLYCFGLLVWTVIANRCAGEASQYTRTINPKLGFLGLLGFAGFLGFLTYHVNKSVYPFAFFMFFGFFGFFFEGKMSNTYMDERYKENKMKADVTANKISMTIIFLAIIILGSGNFMGNLEYTLIALVIAVAVSIALDIFLGEYLLYRYDHDEEPDESEG